MDTIPVLVGLDFHQDCVQVCVEGRDGTVLTNRRCRNDIIKDRGRSPALRPAYAQTDSASSASLR